MSDGVYIFLIKLCLSSTIYLSWCVGLMGNTQKKYYKVNPNRPHEPVNGGLQSGVSSSQRILKDPILIVSDRPTEIQDKLTPVIQKKRKFRSKALKIYGRSASPQIPFLPENMEFSFFEEPPSFKLEERLLHSSENPIVER